MIDSRQNKNFWKPNEKHLGIVTPGTPYNVEFEYDGPKKIQMIETSCGCTQATIDGNTIKTVYTPKDKPAHISGNQEVQKSIKITFQDGTKEKVFIKATIK